MTSILLGKITSSTRGEETMTNSCDLLLTFVWQLVIFSTCSIICDSVTMEKGQKSIETNLINGVITEMGYLTNLSPIFPMNKIPSHYF